MTAHPDTRDHRAEGVADAEEFLATRPGQPAVLAALFWTRGLAAGGEAAFDDYHEGYVSRLREALA